MNTSPSRAPSEAQHSVSAFMRLYHFGDRWWQKIEIFMSVFIMTAMTLITFIYTFANNLYAFFYYLAEKFPSAESFFNPIGDVVLDFTFQLTWTLSFTKAAFAWLIFFMMSYGVRVGGHIGVDALVKLFSDKIQRLLAYIGLGACFLYAGLFLLASSQWVKSLYMLGTPAEDLHQLHILQWHIAIIVPIGFLLVIFRYLEIGYRLYTHQQLGLGLADEAKDVMNLKVED